MNFDNPYWIDLKVTYEYYQASGSLHRTYGASGCLLWRIMCNSDLS